MNKKLISMALTIMLLLSCFCTPVLADTPKSNEVKAELDATALYILGSIKSNIDSNSITYNDYKHYALTLKAGISDNDVTNSLVDFLKDNFHNDGSTSITGTFYPATWYTYIITFLNEIDMNPSDFNDINFIKLLEDYYLNTDNSIECYIEQYIFAILIQNEDDFSNPSDVKAKIEDSILKLYVDRGDDGVGINHWGIYTDNNGQCLITLKSLYSTDQVTKDKVDAAITWTANQLTSDGTVFAFGSASVSGTALALKALAEYNDVENAAKAYEGLKTLKSSTTSGAYPDYAGKDDPNFSSPDALIGLLSYYRSIEGYDTLEVITKEAETTTTPSDNSADINNNKESEESTPDLEQAPATGDFSPIILISITLIVSGIAYISYYRKNA